MAQTKIQSRQIGPPIVVTATSYVGNVIPNADVTDVLKITAQSGALLIKNPSGTLYDMQTLQIVIKDNTTPSALTYGVGFTGGTTVTLPNTTVAGRWLAMNFQYYTSDSLWHIQGYNQE